MTINDGKTTKVYNFDMAGTNADPIESNQVTNPPQHYI